MDFSYACGRFQHYRAAEIVKEVHLEDGMWKTGQDWYFRVGEQAFTLILNALTLSPKTGVKTILDLPSGCGRVARHLRAGFPDAEITASDLLTYGVDFCAEVLGCRPLYSNPELTAVDFGKSFDVIWVGSLFTHMDFEIFRRWSRHLLSFLNDDGILVMTLNAEWTLEMHKSHGRIIDNDSFAHLERAYLETGKAFQPYTHIKTAAEVPFGVSAFRPDVTIAEALTMPDVRVISYTERGWGDNQDVLVLCKRPRLKHLGTT